MEAKKSMSRGGSRRGSQSLLVSMLAFLSLPVPIHSPFRTHLPADAVFRLFVLSPPFRSGVAADRSWRPPRDHLMQLARERARGLLWKRCLPPFLTPFFSNLSWGRVVANTSARRASKKRSLQCPLSFRVLRGRSSRGLCDNE